MLVGQQLGPFLIEKELGAGAMGAVYRGKYVKTGQLVAVKVMAPGLGTSSASSAARFEREAAILKQLHHPNIVRLFGVGKYKGTAYYAMEYVKGESLDHIMARRDRMSWEEVVDLGMQLCSALQHAHEAGIVHRDLKPSNLMILDDGTLKLTDFGIAKDLDVTGLTGANNTIGTAAYMSPEQCKGDPHLTFKSDLYSLGVVFYELITGKKPFVAENAMEMFLLHLNGTPQRASRIVLDLPVWLDTLISQLLEKKPELRPRDAAMVGEVLASIQEKVEAQHSAGLEAARSRRGDLAPGKRIEGEDRDAARTLLGKKKRKPKKKGKKALVRTLQAVGLLLLLIAVVLGIVFSMQKPSAASLYAQAERLMQSEKPERRSQARDGPIKDYLRWYGDLDPKQTGQMQLWADDVDAADDEQKLDRYIAREKSGKGFPIKPRDDAQAAAFKAALAETEGDRPAATESWKQCLDQSAGTGLNIVARRHLAALGAVDDEDTALDALRKKLRDTRVEPELDVWRTRAFLARRQDQLGDRFGAKQKYEQFVLAIGKQENVSTDVVLRAWQLYAAVKLRQMKDSLENEPQDAKARKAFVDKIVEDAVANEVQGKGSLLDLRALAHDVATLYKGDDEFGAAVAKAKDLVAKIDARR
jgi:serine/threonine-protein kinase